MTPRLFAVATLFTASLAAQPTHEAALKNLKFREIGGKKDRSLTGILDASDGLDKAIDTGHKGKTSVIDSGKKTKQDVQTNLGKIKEAKDVTQ